MRGVYIQLAFTIFNFLIGCWNIGFNIGTDHWLSMFVVAPLSFFCAGFSGLNTYHKYKAYQRRFQNDISGDSRVNWRRDGF